LTISGSVIATEHVRRRSSRQNEFYSPSQAITAKNPQL
jgi:hypothetical protein